MSATDIVPADTTIANVSDAAHELACCRIARDVIDEHEQAVRSWLLQRALDTKEAEGASPRYAVTDDGGRKLANVSLSEPEPKPKVADQHEFAAWAKAQGFEVQWVDRIEVDDDGVVAAALASADDGDIAKDEFYDLVRPALIAHRRPVWSQSLPDDVLAACDLHESGALIDHTGELVPGIEWEYRSKPTLSVRVDKDARLRQTKTLRQRLPQIEGGGDG